jgi:hypothetical protein
MGLRSGLALTALVAIIGASSAYAQQAPAEVEKNQKAVKGAWKTAAGSCDMAYFKTAEDNKTARGEAGMKVTVVNAGMTVNGTFILAGAREGQIVNPMSDKMIFLLEPQDDGKLHIIPLGEPVTGWPEVVLELCPGSR